MFKNVASQKIELFAFDTATGSPKTGDAANLTAYVAKDFAAASALGDTSATEIDATNAKGWYVFDLTQAETNADHLLFTGKSSTAGVAVVGRPVETTPANFTAQAIDSNGRMDIGKILGTASAGAAGYMGLDWGHVNAPTTAVSLSGTTVGTLTTYTGNTPQTGDAYASLGTNGAGLTALGDARLGNLDAPVSGVAAAVWLNGTRALTDKAGFALTQGFPTNFASLAITGGGAVTAGTVSDKTGYSGAATNLAGLALTTDMAALAKTTDLTPLAKTTDLSALAKTTDLATLATIQGVTDKINSMLEADGSNYRLTVAALVNAPAGEGGGGNLTSDQAAQLSETHTRALLALPAVAPGTPTGIARQQDVQPTILLSE